MFNNELKREENRADGAILLSETCWDGRRRVTVVIHKGHVSYLQRFVSSAMMNIVIQQNPELPRSECDYGWARPPRV